MLPQLLTDVAPARLRAPLHFRPVPVGTARLASTDVYVGIISIEPVLLDDLAPGFESVLMSPIRRTPCVQLVAAHEASTMNCSLNFH